MRRTANDAAISMVRVMTLGRGIASTSSTSSGCGRAPVSAMRSVMSP
jgi:hypothetical protein